MLQSFLHLGLRAVVFDIDDTLYLERDYVRSGFEALNPLIQARFGVSDFAAVCWALFEQGVRGNTFNRAMEQLHLEPDPELLAGLVQAYRQHTPQISLLTDAKQCLDKAKTLFDIAFLTDGPLSSQRAKAKALNLEAYSSHIVYTAQISAPKPSPLGFSSLADSLGHAPQAMIYIADNPTKDFAGPKSLGWHTLRVRRPGALHRELASRGDVDAECTDFYAL